MKKYLIFLFAVVAVAACVKDIEPGIDNPQGPEEIILQERDPNLPTVWAMPVPEPVSTRTIAGGDFIGKGYKIGNTIVGDDINASDAQVVNVDKIMASADLALLTTNPVRSTSIESYAYNDWNRYVDQHKFTNKIKSGFNLNLGIFKIGRQKTITETFYTSNIEESRLVYGELGIEFRYAKHSMQTSPVSRKIIASKYLDNVFLRNLYNQSINVTREQFGDFIITDYYSGGRATALYRGEYKSNESVEIKERDMQETISASFSINVKKPNFPIDSVSGDASLEFGRNNWDNVESYDKFTNVYSYIRTIGGMPTSGANNDMGQDIQTNNHDLNGWLGSLASSDNHTLIGFENEGLYPLSDYLLEENFAVRLADTHAGFLPAIDMLQEPMIEIVKLYVRKVGTERLYDVVPVLSTRHGDKLIIADTPSSQKTDAELRAYNDPANFAARANQIMAQKAPYYQCMIVARPSVIINPILRDPLAFDLTGIREAGMFKLYDADTDRYYFLDMNKRVALTFYSDQFILFMYGMWSWDSLPSAPSFVTVDSIINNFRIYGL